ncbi:MAG TPA: hypothetical protein IGS53_17825 [Leptolyngbyaceae cyanobacterium M33_DOE_097]|uniref:DUF7734 domain-containing protein n=1 Tax=Oscillatoriales cyanobacterium SpSt-418 TaxID=2282169 RepID=A0A7C3PGQ1_9CYAN|nr:hypothetical protein [Leptolyngbyaceae cyanobacterium M33_DOE_097]
MNQFTRLERYTEKQRQEVLLVTAEIANQVEQVLVFRGFSSSLTNPTAYDPDIPVLPESAKIVSIDRLRGPYNPTAPEYLQQGLTWDELVVLLEAVGV